MIFSYLQNMQSHPSWVCGLKLLPLYRNIRRFRSHPSWVCGLKQNNIWNTWAGINVTPFVGVWIETRDAARYQLQAAVTPFVGVWIET